MSQVMEQINPDKMLDIEAKVYAVIETIYDPEIPVNIYDLGLIYDINIYPDQTVHVMMTLTAPGCPVSPLS